MSKAARGAVGEKVGPPCLGDGPPAGSLQAPEPSQARNVTSQTFGNTSVSRFGQVYFYSFFFFSCKLHLIELWKVCWHSNTNLKRQYISITQCWLFTNKDKWMELHNPLYVRVGFSQPWTLELLGAEAVEHCSWHGFGQPGALLQTLSRCPRCRQRVL